MGAQFVPDPEGIREFLRMDPTLAAQLYERGQEVVNYAKSIAPVGGDPDRDRNKKEHPGTYRDSIKGRFRVGPSRMAYQVYSDDQKAYWIEYGASKMPKFAVLRRALDQIEGAGAALADEYGNIEEYFATNTKAAAARAERLRRKANKTKE